MNTRLLRKIAQAITEHPRQFDMQTWHFDKQLGCASFLYRIAPVRQVSCGTTHCIGGWAQILDPRRDPAVHPMTDAQRLLGLSREQSWRLFDAHNWPKQFQGTKDPDKMSAPKAAARIEHFIKTKGRE